MEDRRGAAQRIVIGITVCLWAVTVFAGGGYWYGRETGALLGAIVGAFLASAILAGKWLSDAAQIPEDDIVRKNRARDWTRLLDHEKCQFARQLEREGDTARAQEIYEHLVELRYDDPMPYERLAAIYRAHDRREEELSVLTQAVDVLTGPSSSASPHAPSRTLTALRERREVLLQSSPTEDA